MRTLIFIAFMFLSALSFAQTSPSADEVEIRAREVGRALRCVVCQNQSIEDSDASLAKDMRVIVRERIKLGESDKDIIEFMRLRYGDYVLLKPPLQRNTYLLWFLPALVILGMIFWVSVSSRKRQEVAVSPTPLSDDERAILKRLMDNNL